MTRIIAKGALTAMLAWGCAFTTRGADDDVVAKHSGTYLADVGKLDDKYTAQRRDLSAKFSDALKALETRYAATRNLDGVLAVRETLKTIEDPFVEITAPTVKNTDELKALIEKRAKAMQTLDAEEAKMRQELKTKHIAYLERVKGELTAELKIDEALAIRNEIERLGETQQRNETEEKTEPEKSEPAKPETAKVMAEADVIKKLQELKGSTITFTGRVKALEKDTLRPGHYIVVMTGGLKVRMSLPNGLRDLPQQGKGLSAKSAWGVEGFQVCVRGTIAEGAVYATMTDCFTSAQFICIRCGVPYRYPRYGLRCLSCRDLVYK